MATAGGGAARVHGAALRRGSSVTGVVRIGPRPLALAFGGLAERRVQIARPGEAQIVEPGELVVFEPRRQDLRLPRRRRRLETLQLRDDGVEGVRSLPLLARHEVLPSKQEAQEILARDRLDFSAQPLHRVAVDAREERAIAPLGLGRARREESAHDDAFGDELRERRIDVGARHSPSRQRSLRP